VNFIDLENLRRNKQASGRHQDLADLENLMGDKLRSAAFQPERPDPPFGLLIVPNQTLTCSGCNIPSTTRTSSASSVSGSVLSDSEGSV
jgi:hypothetical protein